MIILRPKKVPVPEEEGKREEIEEVTHVLFAQVFAISVDQSEKHRKRLIER